MSLGKECSRQMQDPEQHVLPGQAPGKATATSLRGSKEQGAEDELRDWGWEMVMQDHAFYIK